MNAWAAFFGGLGVVAVSFWVAALVQCWDVARAWTVGPTGSLTVATCTQTHSRRDPMQLFTRRWDCDGNFTTADGERWGRVTTALYADERPGPTVAGRLSGPGADRMWSNSDIPDVIAVFALAVGLPFGVRWLFWTTVDQLAPVTGWPKPPKAPRDPSKPPQVRVAVEQHPERYARPEPGTAALSGQRPCPGNGGRITIRA
jgi:hypothetical protein